VYADNAVEDGRRLWEVMVWVSDEVLPMRLIPKWGENDEEGERRKESIVRRWKIDMVVGWRKEGCFG